MHNNNEIIYFRRKKEKKFSYYHLGLLGSVLLFLISLAVQLHVTNALAIKGKEIVSLQNRREQLSKEISEMELEQSKYLSLKYIEEQAQILGFIKNDTYALKIDPSASQASLTPF